MLTCLFLSCARLLRLKIHSFSPNPSQPLGFIIASARDSSFYAWSIGIQSGCCHRTMIERPDSAVSSVAVSTIFMHLPKSVQKIHLRHIWLMDLWICIVVGELIPSVTVPLIICYVMASHFHIYYLQLTSIYFYY